ncbi:MAG: hypothetical protein ABL308_10495 [Oceanicaulis sp.]
MPFRHRLERLEALQSGLRSAKPRPDTVASWFAAGALLASEQDEAALIEAVRARREEIGDAVGRHTAPSGGLRWVYAAILAAHETSVERFAAMRDVLRDRRKASETGGLHAGGARAALVLALSDLSPAEAAQRFFALKAELNPPWWRRDPSVTDTFAAAHAVRGDAPASVSQARRRAEEVFKSDSRTRHRRRDGAKFAAINEAEPRSVLQRFDRLDALRKSQRTLKHRVDRTILLDWASQGVEAEDLDQIAQIIDELPRHSGGDGAGLARLAHLTHTGGKGGGAAAAANALSAVVAAQAAAAAASAAAVTVAVSAST